MDGVVLIMDMGSSVMTAELVLEDLDDKRVQMADCPIVEGAIAAAVAAESGDNLADVILAAQEAGKAGKL